MASKQNIWIVYLFMQRFYKKFVKVTYAVCLWNTKERYSFNPSLYNKETTVEYLE